MNPSSLEGTLDWSGSVIAPNGTITLNGKSALSGRIVADQLIVNGTALLGEPEDN